MHFSSKGFICLCLCTKFRLRLQGSLHVKLQDAWIMKILSTSWYQWRTNHRSLVLNIGVLVYLWFTLMHNASFPMCAVVNLLVDFYRFKCLDLDGNGKLTPGEMRYFYEDHPEKPVPFEIILCQIIDMIAPEVSGGSSSVHLFNISLLPIWHDFQCRGRSISHCVTWNDQISRELFLTSFRIVKSS